MTTALSTYVLNELWFDADAREMLLRSIITERLAEHPPPRSDEHIVPRTFLRFAISDWQMQ